MQSFKFKKDDFIWTVSNSFAATANCILLSGYKVDFVDIDEDNWNLSISKLKNFPLRKKRKLPKAIIVVHLAGLPVDPIQLKKLSKKYKFKIIEDVHIQLVQSITIKKLKL